MNHARWTPGIGDPTIMGWVTVAAYFVAAVLCLASAIRSSDDKRLWSWSGAFLALLGINKQLDLQSWFTQAARDLALVEGWYDYRGIVQAMFIVAMVVGCSVGGVRLWKAARERPICIRLAFAGFAILIAFIAIRAASFHHIDRLIGSSIFGFRFNWIFELGGIAIIGASALCARFRSAH
jgi:hypothetical protein